MTGVQNQIIETKRIQVIKKNSPVYLLVILEEESIWLLAERKHMVMYWYDSEIHIILNMLKNMAANVHFFINVYKYLSMKS